MTKCFRFGEVLFRRGIILEPFFLIYNVYSTNFILKNTQRLKILQKVSLYNIEKSEANYVCSDFLRQRSIFCLHSTRVISLISNIGIFRWKFKADIFFFFKKILRSSTLLLDQFDASKCNASSSLACPGQFLQTASHFPLFLLFVSSLNYFVLKKISISILITYLNFIFDQKCIDFFFRFKHSFWHLGYFFATFKAQKSLTME